MTNFIKHTENYYNRSPFLYKKIPDTPDGLDRGGHCEQGRAAAQIVVKSEHCCDCAARALLRSLGGAMGYARNDTGGGTGYIRLFI